MLLFQRVIFRVHRIVWHCCNHFSRGNLHSWVRKKRLKADEPVLNIGAGGEIGKIVNCGDCTSIDISDDRMPDILADVCSLHSHFDEGQFETVFAVEVLEHVVDPATAVKEIHRVLKPGGLFVLSTPYIFEMHDLPHDYWRFTEYGLRKLLEQFEEIHIDRRNGYFRTILTPLFRLSFSPYWTDRIVGISSLMLAYLLYPLILIGDVLIRSKKATTGYHVSARKPMTKSMF